MGKRAAAHESATPAQPRLRSSTASQFDSVNQLEERPSAQCTGEVFYEGVRRIGTAPRTRALGVLVKFKAGQFYGNPRTRIYVGFYGGSVSRTILREFKIQGTAGQDSPADTGFSRNERPARVGWLMRLANKWDWARVRV